MSRVAIVTTSFNHARFLPECFESAQAQTDRRFLHVVVDDGSPDDGWNVIMHYAQRHGNVIAVRLPQNVGLAAAFHAGVGALPPEAADWLLKCDADDKVHPRYVGEILHAAAEDPKRNVIFSPCQHFGLQTGVYRYPTFDPAKMRDVFMIPGPAAFKRSLWDAVGGYDQTMRSAEDWDFYIRAQLAVGLTPHQLAAPRWYYRAHDGPRASHEGMAQLAELREYWRGHTRETALACSRSWGAWRQVAA